MRYAVGGGNSIIGTERIAMPDGDGRRAAFLAAWRDHGNVRRAMREADVGSPTTAYRWIEDWKRQPTADWHLVRTSTPRIPPGIAEQVIALRERNPAWGKLRIANRLAATHGASVISPTGVRSVLREAGLWSPPEIPTGDLVAREIDTDRLLDDLQRGIRHDLFSRPLEAVSILEGVVWAPLLARPETIARLLREPEAGSWLLRGALQLAHALIEVGRWGSALRYLWLVDGWLAREDAHPSRRQRAYQDEGDRWTLPHDARWHTGTVVPAGAERVSLRHDEIWLETQQYLGVVLRDVPGERAVEALEAARRALEGDGGRELAADRLAHYRGVIGHDLAALMLRRGYSPRLVLRTLDVAVPLLEEPVDLPMRAAAALTRAEALARIPRARADRVEAVAHAALDLAAASPALMPRVRAAVHGTRLLVAARGAQDEDRDRIAEAARIAIARGFAGQARTMLERPELLALVDGLEAELREAFP
jgi:hypothetical protein